MAAETQERVESLSLWRLRYGVASLLLLHEMKKPALEATMHHQIRRRPLRMLRLVQQMVTPARLRSAAGGQSRFLPRL